MKLKLFCLCLGLLASLSLFGLESQTEKISRLEAENKILATALIESDNQLQRDSSLLTELKILSEKATSELKTLKEILATLTDELQTSKLKLHELDSERLTLLGSLRKLQTENNWLKGGFGLSVVGNVAQFMLKGK